MCEIQQSVTSPIADLSELKTITNQEVSFPLAERLRYLWRLCNTLTLKSEQLGQTCSTAFNELLHKHSIQIPNVVEQRFCSSCKRILVNGSTCSIRIRSRHRNSKCNKSSGRKCKAELVGSSVAIHEIL